MSKPYSKYHNGKELGDFTHYGDHAKWLEIYIQNNNSFDINTYKDMWFEKMQSFKGYIDGSSKKTLEILQNDISQTKGSTSSDLSIVGSISPLLYVSSSKDEFLLNVSEFIAFTHNDHTVLNVASYFASILYEVANGTSIKNAIKNEQVPSLINKSFDTAIQSKSQDTDIALRGFGIACNVNGGFEGTVHLLIKYDNFKEAMIQNAKVGGDSSSRGMIVAMIMGAANYEIPVSWIEGTKGIRA